VPNQCGAPNNCRGAEKSQQCHKHFLQYSKFAFERPQTQIWGRQTCPGRHLTSLRPWVEGTVRDVENKHDCKWNKLVDKTLVFRDARLRLKQF